MLADARVGDDEDKALQAALKASAEEAALLAVVEAADREAAAAHAGSCASSHSTAVSVASGDDDADGQDGWQTVPDRKRGKATGAAPRDDSSLPHNEAARIVQESLKWGADGLEVCLSDRGLNDADICLLAESIEAALVGFLLDAGSQQRVGIDVRLNGNKCGASGMGAVCAALGSVCASEILGGSAPFVRALFLHKNTLDDEAVCVVAGLIRNQTAGALEELHLSDNRWITTSGVEALLAAAVECRMYPIAR